MFGPAYAKSHDIFGEKAVSQAGMEAWNKKNVLLSLGEFFLRVILKVRNLG
jgi:hypothetical protein